MGRGLSRMFRNDSRASRFLEASAPAGFAHVAIQNRCLGILSQSLQRERLVELNNIGELARVLPFIIIEPDQGRLHDVHAGNVFGYGKTIGVLLGQTLKVFDNVEQVSRWRIARFRRSGSR